MVNTPEQPRYSPEELNAYATNDPTTTDRHRPKGGDTL